jgi:hypothetical protein
VLTTVQALGLRGEADDDLLRYAAGQELVLISHDRQTLPAAAAYARNPPGERCTGAIVRDPEDRGMARLVDDLALLASPAAGRTWRIKSAISRSPSESTRRW